jgi:hypothetical protein
VWDGRALTNIQTGEGYVTSVFGGTRFDQFDLAAEREEENKDAPREIDIRVLSPSFEPDQD